MSFDLCIIPSLCRCRAEAGSRTGSPQWSDSAEEHSPESYSVCILTAPGSNVTLQLNTGHALPKSVYPIVWRLWVRILMLADSSVARSRESSRGRALWLGRTAFSLSIHQSNTDSKRLVSCVSEQARVRPALVSYCVIVWLAGGNW